MFIQTKVNGLCEQDEHFVCVFSVQLLQCWQFCICTFLFTLRFYYFFACLLHASNEYIIKKTLSMSTRKFAFNYNMRFSFEWLNRVQETWLFFFFYCSYLPAFTCYVTLIIMCRFDNRRFIYFSFDKNTFLQLKYLQFEWLLIIRNAKLSLLFKWNEFAM